MQRVTRELARQNRTGALFPVSAGSRTPTPDGNPLVGRDLGDLFLGANNGEVGVERLVQGAGGDFESDAPRVAEADREAGAVAGHPPGHTPRTSTSVARRSLSR